MDRFHQSPGESGGGDIGSLAHHRSSPGTPVVLSPALGDYRGLGATSPTEARLMDLASPLSPTGGVGRSMTRVGQGFVALSSGLIAVLFFSKRTS